MMILVMIDVWADTAEVQSKVQRLRERDEIYNKYEINKSKKKLKKLKNKK